MNHQGLSLKLSHPQWMWILGFPIVALSSPFIATGVILMTIMHPIKNTSGAFLALPATALYVMGIFSLWIGAIVYNFGRRFLSIQEEYKALRGGRPPVLYLRSFKDEPVTATRIDRPNYSTGSGLFAIPKLTIRTEEEAIFKILNRIGDPIAIGVPGERLPRIGMPRLYVTNDEWENVVQELMKNARLVLIRVGNTAGVLREVEMAVKTKRLSPEQVCLLLPYEKEPGQSESILPALNKLLPKEIPSYHAAKVRDLSIAGIVYFDADWTPHLIELYYHSLDISGDVKNYAEDILESAFNSNAANPKFDVNDLIGSFVTKEDLARLLKARRDEVCDVLDKTDDSDMENSDGHGSRGQQS